MGLNQCTVKVLRTKRVCKNDPRMEAQQILKGGALSSYAGITVPQAFGPQTRILAFLLTEGTLAG